MTPYIKTKETRKAWAMNKEKGKAIFFQIIKQKLECQKYFLTKMTFYTEPCICGMYSKDYFYSH